MNFCGAIFIVLWLVHPCFSQEKHTPDLDTFKNYEEMESYLSTTEKISGIENPKNDSYLEAYNLHHIGTLKTHSKISKRATPEFIKFELTDAKEPDEATREFFKKIQKSLNISEVAKSTEKESENESGEEKVKDLLAIQKRSIDLFGTGGSRKKAKKTTVATKELDTIMKLLIDINQPSRRKQRNNELAPVVAHVAGLDHRYSGISPKPNGYHLNQFGEKYKQYPFSGSQQFVYSLKHYPYPGVSPNYVTTYVPYPVSGLKASAVPLTNLQTATAPEVSQIRSISRPDSAQLVKVLPEINYVIKEVPAPNLKQPLPISHQHSSGTTGQTSEIDYRGVGGGGGHHHIYGPTPLPAQSKGILQEQQDQQQIGYATHEQVAGKEINNEHQLLRGGNEQLIPKQAIAPAVERNSLYADPKYGSLMTLVGKSPADQLYGLTYILGKELHLAQRPEDNTAPIVFHHQGVDNGAGVPHAVHLNYAAPAGAEHGILEHGQSIKPITETPEEGELQVGPVVHVTPQPHPTALSYKELHSALSPNYDLTDDGQKQLHQYASRYAFGYHVRDFHSGNDYAHRQNRDLDGVTRGQYHILLPDGRIQNVIYHADKSGFHADVSFESGIDHHHH